MMSEDKRQSSINSVHTLVTGNNSKLAPLCKRAAYLQQLNRILCSQLPSPLNTHCQLANITTDAAILHAESPAWAARLRYSVPDILKLIQKRLDLPGIKSIRIKVMIPDGKSLSNQRKAPMISAKTARLLADSANCIRDPRLRTSLLRLCRHAD